MGPTQKINANAKIGSGRGGTVSILVTIQNATPVTAMPNITHRNFFITDPLRVSGFVQLSQKLSLNNK
jgi:hypothetical protein